jgi:hypothetical protein
VVRLVLEFLGDASDPRWPLVQQTLEEAGAQLIRIPPTRSPLLVTALLPDDADVETIIGRLQALDGVGLVELDAMRESFRPTTGEEADGERE